ncbi:exostosin 2 [Seminavis robusta]|uniref:Exostosin 2 n=1 Tax=Seminavis robusta TaxID=568900 RepID=A0A9N8E5W9_9STRA|nr:exostosin 2 [Seminavis robusta]|eukprot:Sro575_g169370.1 exostosin 2 (529) ;mRNA; f:39620-41206
MTRRSANASTSSASIARLVMNHSVAIFLCLGAFWGFWLMYLPVPDGIPEGPHDFITTATRSSATKPAIPRSAASDVQQKKKTHTTTKSAPFLKPFQEVIERAQKNQKHCGQVIPDDGIPEPTQDVIAIANMTTARLPGFGVIDALQQWQQDPQPPNHLANGATNTQCQIPPENECSESQFSVIFMAYNPDRLAKFLRQIKSMLDRKDPFARIIREIILVWNGPREISESPEGQKLLEFVQQEADRLRVVYPLKEGLPNDLMNRYHPDIVKVKTKGILYYDDDGPFYSYEAVLGGFELWKRNSNAQIGAMARTIDLGPRQQAEKKHILGSDRLNDRAFVSHCKPDDVEYNFRYFANFEANMVLPSGSFLHSNYLCFLWHPAFEPIRDYVKAHPVHPDDITVSMMVSQLAGRAPKVYSRRINMETKEAQMQEAARLRKAEQRRRLLFNINWDKNHNMDDDKEKWAQLRSGAINSLVRYFGSMNSGSTGWCLGTEYHKKDKNGDDMCFPDMARFGKLPWLNIDHTQKETCP